MRISDWSSDVCSSDLPLAVLVLLDHGLAVGCATVVDETRGVAIDVGIDDIVFVQGKQEGMPIFGLLAVQRVDLVMSAQLAFVAHHPFALGDRVGRSEEHTSELQSLMRISYAVFCLKKKKLNIQTKHQTYTNSTCI